MLTFVTRALQYRIQKIYSESSNTSGNMELYNKISNSLKKYRRYKIESKLNEGFRDTTKYKTYCKNMEDAIKNFQNGKKAVYKILQERGLRKDKYEDYINCSLNNPFCVENVSDNLYPIGRKVDFFLKQKILKSLFLKEDEL